MVPSPHKNHRTHHTHHTHHGHHGGRARRTPRGTRLAVTAALVAVLLAACGPRPDGGTATPLIDARAAAGNGRTPTEVSHQPGDGTAPDAPTDQDQPADTDVAAMAFADCEAERYTVGHPAAWNANDDDGLLGPCEVFHPEEFEVPERPRDLGLHYAAVMYIDDIDFDELLVADNPNEVLKERETTVDGRRAIVAEHRSTGRALTPEGESTYTWVIDLDGQILVAATTSVGETDYARDKRVLDRMVTEELTIHGTSS